MARSVTASHRAMYSMIMCPGLNVNHEDRLRGMRWEYSYWAGSTDLRDDIIAHSMDTDNFWIEYTKRRLLALGASPHGRWSSRPRFPCTWEMYRPESIVPEDVRRVLPKLKQAGYLMAVISNRDKPFQETMDSHGLTEFFTFRWRAEKWIFTNLSRASSNMH